MSIQMVTIGFISIINVFIYTYILCINYSRFCQVGPTDIFQKFWGCLSHSSDKDNIVLKGELKDIS